MEPLHLGMVIIFLIGYSAIILEYYIKINKTAVATIMAVGTWSLLFLKPPEGPEPGLSLLNYHLGSVSQIVFFLLGAMTLVELIDAHKGFKMITDIIHTRSKRKMLWIIGISVFFLSAILDNLTTTIVMISMLRKLIEDQKERWLIGATIVIAANAGGAWTPIGDVTTTMLWIQGHISSAIVIKQLFLPSLFSLVVCLCMLSFQMKGNYSEAFMIKGRQEKAEPGATLVFLLGILSLVLVPVIRALTGLPPFMGIFIGLGILWLVTDIMHRKHEERKHLRVPFVLTRIDITGVLFFLGILLCINSLEMAGILKSLANWIDIYITNKAMIAVVIGLFSSVVDNVPLVAACMGMYDLQSYPMDAPVWQMIAYTAGTGGSIMIIGSAAGIALMGIEKIDFIWYLKKVSFIALVGFFAGMGLYLLLNAF